MPHMDDDPVQGKKQIAEQGQNEYSTILSIGDILATTSEKISAEAGLQPYRKS